VMVAGWSEATVPYPKGRDYWLQKPRTFADAGQIASGAGIRELNQFFTVGDRIPGRQFLMDSIHHL
jgi:hypothetical protein